MLFLPEQAGAAKFGLEKIDTYLTLSQLGCPVFKSALIKSNESISEDTIRSLREYFESDEVTVRYQYVRPSIHPIMGGNRHRLSVAEIAPLQNSETYLWLLEPINRLTNEYGINLFFKERQCYIEIVGQGFDVSDLNRGQVAPHQTVTSELPVRWGMYNEWWKFLKFHFCTQEEYDQSVDRRTEKLTRIGYTVSGKYIPHQYKCLSMEKLEKLLYFISIIHNGIRGDNYCVSCSISDNHFVFWDIQTPAGKKQVYGVK